MMKAEDREKYIVPGNAWWECPELLGVKSLRMKPPYAPLNTAPVSGLVRLAMDVRNLRGPGPLKMVELGSWAGESAAIWAGSGLFDPLYLVDLWRQPENEGVCEYNMRRFGGAVKMVQADMYQLGGEWAGRGEPLDVVYLDADHSYEATARILPIWWRHLLPGGIMAGHDYNPRAWPGVVRGVDEFAVAQGLKIRTYMDTSWSMVKPG